MHLPTLGAATDVCAHGHTVHVRVKVKGSSAQCKSISCMFVATLCPLASAARGPQPLSTARSVLPPESRTRGCWNSLIASARLRWRTFPYQCCQQPITRASMILRSGQWRHPCLSRNRSTKRLIQQGCNKLTEGISLICCFGARYVGFLCQGCHAPCRQC